MGEHTHIAYERNCYRCQLNQDEELDSLREEVTNLRAAVAAVRELCDRRDTHPIGILRGALATREVRAALDAALGADQ